ncbi:MAG: UDP-N-acetylmuramate dehydrogenase [Cyanobacteria bacterium]|nr:UDP-N-acetylmuramate dehydrogenase [Cyanobacteriota bacterium]MDA0865163.1 UDP-N-acetylmuramate dehydrogenase [Cyanobacteriota bacterium]
MVISLDRQDLLPGTDCPLQRHVSLAGYTSYRVGGTAEWFMVPRTPEQVSAGLAWAHAEGLPVTLLGAGSNLLISDRGLPGLVICSRYLRQVAFDDDAGQITAAAGEPLPNLAWKAARRGWRGLEWAVGIPGTVGGAVFMNAGAHGAATADSLVQAQGLSFVGDEMTWAPTDLKFAYRSSSLQQQPCLVTHATLQLQPGYAPAEVIADTQRALEQRRTTQPYNRPSCGSVFRNPTPHSAGQLIEQTGLKGYQIGQAQVSTLHANFIVNCGGATAMDVLRLIRHVQDQVQTQWSLVLHPEVRLLGEFMPC